MLASSSGDVINPGQTDLEFATAEETVELTVPIELGEGQAILTATGEVYYCRLGEEAICLIDKLDLALPVTVSGDAPSSEAVIDYQLPE
jgi:hypothetical protein